MRTISRRWPASAPRGDYSAQCSYCGAVWRRSLLRRDGAGNLMCPDDDGIDAMTLDQMNQDMATPPPLLGESDAKTEAKVVETAQSLKDRIGGSGWTF